MTVNFFIKRLFYYYLSTKKNDCPTTTHKSGSNDVSTAVETADGKANVGGAKENKAGAEPCFCEDDYSSSSCNTAKGLLLLPFVDFVMVVVVSSQRGGTEDDESIAMGIWLLVPLDNDPNTLVDWTCCVVSWINCPVDFCAFETQNVGAANANNGGTFLDG